MSTNDLIIQPEPALFTPLQIHRTRGLVKEEVG